MWVCRLPVHIGPLGSCEFAEDYHKKRCILPGRCGHRPLRGAYEFAEGLLVLLLHAATPQALRASFPVSEQHQQCSADDSNKAGSRFFRQLFVEHAPREQNRHQNAQLIDGRDDARRAVLKGFIIAQPAAARG